MLGGSIPPQPNFNHQQEDNMMLWKVKDSSPVFCPNCHIRMIELHRTVFQCYKCGVKIMKNEAVADYELERKER